MNYKEQRLGFGVVSSILMVGKRESIELDRLSRRERSIVDLAIEGFTDAQISQQLQITPNTVNSYWVRIRGKIGHISRTELVSTILRQQSAQQIGEVQGSLDALQRQVSKLSEGMETDSETNLQGLWITLNNLPEPIFTVNPCGTIELANKAMGDLIGMHPTNLRDHQITSLVASEDAIRLGNALREVSDGTSHQDHPRVHPFRCRRFDGSQIQIMVQFYGGWRASGPWVTGVVRAYEDAIRVL